MIINSKSSSKKKIGIENLPHLGFGISPRKTVFTSNENSKSKVNIF